jgi:5S rRNA maturation endonuclease (ribonuclease M5)
VRIFLLGIQTKNQSQKNYSGHSKYYDYVVLNELADEACADVESLMEALSVDYRRNRKMLVGCCPVHDGDNRTAWNFYPEGDELRGFWKCRTHHCEKATREDGKLLYGCTLIGLIKGILSKKHGHEISQTEAVNWLIKHLGYKSIAEVKLPSEEQIEKRQYTASIRRMHLTPQQTVTDWTREKLRCNIEIPAEYYLKRGYSAAILDKYDVGLYNRYKRVMVPVYDDKYKQIAGFLGRSIFDQCQKCKLYHGPNDGCPKEPLDFINAAKWKNSPGFESAHYLYNYWFALPKIRETGVALLVEGAGDVWRLEENDIHNGLALFGVDMTEQQRILLDRSGALSLVILLDPDSAGQDGMKKLKKDLGRQYRMFFPKISDDVGGLNNDEITNDIKTILEGIKK